MEIRRRIYLIYVKIVCTFYAHKLGLKFTELYGIYLALDEMVKNKYDGKKTV